MPELERWQAVQDILKDLRGLDPLKRLFWSELNYDHVNQPLSRRGWGDTASRALAENPVLFAAHQDFHIIYARLSSDNLALGQQRPVVSRLLQDHPYALFVFSNAGQDRWHFVNVKMADDPTKRRLFRRITVGQNERLRTASERIVLIDIGDRKHSPLEVQALHDNAFNVEVVTEQFFATFAEMYHRVAADLHAVRGLEEEAGRLAQLLLDRLIFLYFIQKKDWLDARPDYLYARFLDIWKENPKGSNYYSDVLYPLFLCLSNAKAKSDSVGVVPFLNGGLFEESATQPQAKGLALARLSIKNSTFKAIFDELLEKFNFTITEDTPLDVEVAIDPEMLGKIFESLILELEKEPAQDLRKLTGSYYTPRPIVHFMCREALKEHLLTHIAHEDGRNTETVRAKLGALLDLPHADQLDEGQVSDLNQLLTKREAESLRIAILDCRVCDPAVGSGAFPVGMLHEMVAAIGRLDMILEGPKAIHQRNYDYELKKQIVESCLYGVDIQEQAVRLCELRLWLSLVVDYQIDPDLPFARAIGEVPNLPNLSYRIVRGDSLLERLFGHVVQLDQMTRDENALNLIEAIQLDKQAYFREGTTAAKRSLELKILAKQADLAERLIHAKHATLTGYQIAFGEDYMTAKDRKARAEHEGQLKALDDLMSRAAAAKGQLQRLAQQKAAPSAATLDSLRRKHFHAGEAPTFIWHVDFAEVFSGRGGFDVIIANPPYVRVHRLNPDLKEMLWRYYASFKAKADLYTCFIERSVSLLREAGNVCFICSDGWQRLDSYDKLREFILTNAEPRLLLDLRFSVFAEAQVKVSIFLFTRRQHPDHRSSVSQFAAATSPDQIPSLHWRQIPVTHFITSYSQIFDTSWSEHTAAITATLKAVGTRLGDFLDVSFGLKTGDDSRFIVTAKIDQHHKPLCRGANISRYRIQWADEYVNYRPAQMRAHRSTARPGDRERFECEKVLVRDTDAQLECALDINAYYVKDVLIVRSLDGSIDPGYVVAMLNSTLMRWFYQRTFPTIHVQADELRSLPFIHPSTNSTLGALLSSLGRKRQASRDKNTAQSLERAIDDVVFSLFGMTASQAEMITRDL